MDECIITQANSLPEGWCWHDWDDGSGALYAPDGRESFYSYDRAPYASAGWIEYKANKDSGWDVFCDGMAQFKMHAESSVLVMVANEQSAQTGIEM